MHSARLPPGQSHRSAQCMENGKVTGIKATQYDGTEVTLHANKGVVVATGGFAANIDRVMSTNTYWADGDITSSTQTTNRSSLVGDGIDMATAVGAGTTGMGHCEITISSPSFCVHSALWYDLTVKVSHLL